MNRYGSCGNAVGMYGKKLRPFPGEEIRPKIELVRINIQEFVNRISLQWYFSHDLTVLGTCIMRCESLVSLIKKLNLF